MDGFAVRSSDTYGASPSLPIYLKVIGEIQMGDEAKISINTGEAVKIATGGMLPPNADAVVMVEDTEYLDSDTIEVKRGVSSFENTIQIGDDVKSGEIVLEKGRVLNPYCIGILAGIGVVEVDVYRRIEVGIISTGDELVDPHVKPRPGQIRNVNSYLIGSLVLECGGIPNYYGIVKDDFSELREISLNAINNNDLVLITGGSSIGVRDLTLDVINSLGKPGVLIHGVSMKPGKPTIIGKVKGKPIIGLPGHPTSGMMVFKILIKPLILKLQRASQQERYITARITRNVPSLSGREDYIRVKLHQEGDEYLASPLFGPSSILSTMVKADGIVKIRLDDEGLYEGELVKVMMI
jgi:molybdopterin molybdotransferase